MPSFIPKDFTPSPDTINKLRQKGIFPDFLENCVDDAFQIYWNEQKAKGIAAAKKSSWNQTYFIWAQRAHQGKVGMEWEKNRHRRESHGKAYKGDLFADVLDNLQGKPKKRETRPLQKAYPNIIRDNPQRQVAQGGKPMTAEEAFEALRKII